MNPIRLFISSVQMMLFSDRLEFWNPGSLRESHGSYPGNPLIAEPLYLTRPNRQAVNRNTG